MRVLGILRWHLSGSLFAELRDNGDMVSPDEVRSAIDKAGEEFARCWEVLVAMKHGPICSDLGERIVGFQPNLARALFRLDELYRRLRAAQRDAIRLKATTPSFDLRIRELASHLEHVKTVLKLGKALGDAYAWFFYRNAQHRLREHLARPPIPHLPPGVGGRGELAFITNVRPERFMVLYHGITTFLRLGDLSFIDVEAGDVVALAELKTRLMGPNQYKVQVHMIGSDRSRMPFENVPIRGESEGNHQMDALFKEKLERQVKGMEAGIHSDRPNSRADVYDGFRHPCMQSLAGKMEQADHACERAGPGLLLTGIRYLPGASFTDRVMTPLESSFMTEALTAIAKIVAEMNDPESADNAGLIGALSADFFPGCAPLFWWPVETKFLQKLYFGEIVVVTIYNPAHLLKRIRMVGFEVSTQKPYKIERRVGNDKMIELGDIDWFLRAVGCHLLKEEKAVEFMSRLIEKIENHEIPPDCRIDLDIASNLI